MTRARPPKWSTEPIVEQLARLGAGYRDGWPDEATRSTVMAAVQSATADLQRRLASARRQANLLKAEKTSSDARAKAP